MKLYIKNMVSSRCIMIVKSELQKLGLHYTKVELGEVVIKENISLDQQNILNIRLKQIGLEILIDKKNTLFEKTKTVIFELVHYSEEEVQKINISDYLSEKLNCNYTYLANLFSEKQGTTIEKYLLVQKIERVKELLIYNDLNITEIADKMQYSSVAHLSNQFKKITGLTPTQYKLLKVKIHKPVEIES